jgi:hypothetical protein
MLCTNVKGSFLVHPQPSFCTTTKKKVREKSTEKKYGKKSTGKNIWEKSTGKYVEKSKGKGHVTSGDVISGQACARYYFR